MYAPIDTVLRRIRISHTRYNGFVSISQRVQQTAIITHDDVTRTRTLEVLSPHPPVAEPYDKQLLLRALQYDIVINWFRVFTVVL